ncbi:MAG TPA: enoyl-CoA hydratase/isomerase family protein [Streptomyces sp.]|nr:enoyl-CoA hydratase/isomerase family protein [Streptomyces sp.]
MAHGESPATSPRVEAPDATGDDASARVLVGDEGAVRVLTLSRPGRLNALDDRGRARLLAAVEEAMGHPGVRVLVLTGEGGDFSAGGDLTAMSTDPAVASGRLAVVTKLFRTLAAGPKPVIAAVEGRAYGLGLGLAAVSDHTVAARDAIFCCPFGRVGLVADSGLHHTLPARVGMGRAKRMLLFAEVVEGATAAEWGLADRLCEPGEALAEALRAARSLLSSAPLSQAESKRILADGTPDLDEALRMEGEAQARVVVTDDFAEGTRAFFGKRRPVFRGR